MGLARSTFYDTPFVPLDGDELLARIGAICDEFECYGYRRVGAALRHQGVEVNGKKLRRLMREHGLQPKPRRRYVVTTDSNHAGPFYPDLAKNLVSDGPNQLWVADLTCPRLVKVFFFPSSLSASRGRRLRSPKLTPGAVQQAARRQQTMPAAGQRPVLIQIPTRQLRAIPPGRQKTPLASHRVQNQLEGLSRSRLQRQRRNSLFAATAVCERSASTHNRIDRLLREARPPSRGAWLF